QNHLLRITARLVLATLIILVLVVGKPFLVPFAWSLLIALASLKFINWTEEKTILPLGLIIFLFLLLVLLILFSIGYFFYIELDRIFANMPEIAQKISDRLHELSVKFGSIGITLPDHLDKSYINDWVQKHNDSVSGYLSTVGMNIWNVVLILFYLFFLLYYKDLVPQFFTAHVKDKRQLVIVRKNTVQAIQLIRSYIFGMLILTLISAGMNYIVFLIFGLKFAIFFAVFLALLNLIPLVGNLIGLAIIMLFAIVTKDNMLVPVLIFALLAVVNFLQDNVVRPWLIGDKLKINAFSVFLAIIVGGMIWGVSGMILFIPLVGIVKIILENHRQHGNYAIFFAEVPKKSTYKTPSVEADDKE
ncbi:MAG: AI-2E family transporter, partial [Clostridiales bacterium]|nr:AI-2E family transporter [Clostridiales bacterium]